MSQNKRNKKKNSRFGIVMGIIWALIAGAYVAAIVHIYNYDDSYSAKPEYVYNEIAARNYGGVYSRYKSLLNSRVNIDEYSEYDEIVALGEYQGAAAMKKIYEYYGVEQKEAYYDKKMSELEAKLGALSFATEDIEDILGK